MKPVLQTKRGLGGNCLAACLASIFEVPLESIPDLAPPECFKDWTVQSRLRRQWLAQHGLDYLEIDMEKQRYHWTSGSIPAIPCLFAVKSPTPEMREKGFGHFVVGQIREERDGVYHDVIHDPLGKLAEHYDITAVGFFVPIAPERIALQANHDALQRLYAEVKDACALVGMERYCTHEMLMEFLKERLLAGAQINQINSTMDKRDAHRLESMESRVKQLETELDRVAPLCLKDGKPITDSFGNAMRLDVGYWSTRSETAEARIKKLETQNGKLCRIWRADHIYIQLLEKELSDVMPLASLHGFTSKRTEEGTAARHAINQAIAELGTGSPST